MALLPNGRNEELATRITEVLAERPYTAQAIIDRLDAPRSTVYSVIKDLQDAGHIRPLNPLRSRNVEYCLGTKAGPNSIIPSMTYQGETYKAPFFLQVDEQAVLKPFEQLFLSLARILKAAERLQDGASLDQTELVLRRAKTELIKSSANFRELHQLAEQIIKDQRFWNPGAMAQFNKDEAWRPKYADAVIDHYSHNVPKDEADA